MTIKAYNAGSLSLSEIRAEFGGPTTGISLYAYRAGGSYVGAGTVGYPSGSSASIPSSGSINIRAFYGSSAIVATGITVSTSGYGAQAAEGLTTTATASFTGTPNGTTIYWTISHISTANADFSATSGSFTVNSNSGSFMFAAVGDSTTEGTETFQIQLRTGSTSGPVILTSGAINVVDLSKTIFYFNDTIGSYTNYNLRSRMISAGWDQSNPVDATVTINTGAFVTSSSVALPAWTDGGGTYPNGGVRRLICNGAIIGRGGPGGAGGTVTNLGTISSATAGTAGGPALTVLQGSPVLRVWNYSIIGGGGGGGGGGGAAYAEYADKFTSVMTGVGGSGGGGGIGLANGGAAGGAYVPGGYGYNGNPGGGGTEAAYGGGGASASGYLGYAVGGAGGGTGPWGQDGFSGGAGAHYGTSGVVGGGAAGGAGGAAVTGGANIEWNAIGKIAGSVDSWGALTGSDPGSAAFSVFSSHTTPAKRSATHPSHGGPLAGTWDFEYWTANDAGGYSQWVPNGTVGTFYIPYTSGGSTTAHIYGMADDECTSFTLYNSTYPSGTAIGMNTFSSSNDYNTNKTTSAFTLAGGFNLIKITVQQTAGGAACFRMYLRNSSNTILTGPEGWFF